MLPGKQVNNELTDVCQPKPETNYKGTVVEGQPAQQHRIKKSACNKTKSTQVH